MSFRPRSVFLDGGEKAIFGTKWQGAWLRGFNDGLLLGARTLQLVKLFLSKGLRGLGAGRLNFLVSLQ